MNKSRFSGSTKVLLISLTLFFLLSAIKAGAAPAKTRLTEKQAVDHLISRIQKDRLYADWTTISCLSFMIEETTQEYFDIAVREKHGGKCPGDPLTAPVVDRFRINRKTGSIQWYDLGFELRPYKDAVKERKGGK